MPARAIVLLALAILATPLATEAQAAEKMFKVGMLVIASREQAAWFINPFEDELRGLGYLPGRNIVFEHRFANGKAELLPRLAAEMVRQKMDVIVTPSNQNTIVAKVATSDIPIVAMFLSQPVAMGLVASLPRPGGNVTGLTQDVDAELSAKRLEILREVAPQARRVAVLVDPAYPGDKPAQQALADAAHKLDVTLEFIDVRSPEGLRPCFRGRDAAARRRTPYHGPSALRHQPVADSRTRGQDAAACRV